MEAAVPSLKKIAYELNGVSEAKLEVETLDWNSPKKWTASHSPVDLVIAADVVWVEALIKPLVNSIKGILLRLLEIIANLRFSGSRQVQQTDISPSNEI